MLHLSDRPLIAELPNVQASGGNMDHWGEATHVAGDSTPNPSANLAGVSGRHTSQNFAPSQFGVTLPVRTADFFGGALVLCCEHMFDGAYVRRQVEHLRDGQTAVVLSDATGHKCRFGLIATFYPTNEKREVILRCQECGRRWQLTVGHEVFSVQEA